MGNISGKINLAKLAHVNMELDSSKEKGKKVKGIFIPIEANKLFSGKDGNVYLDLICFDSPNEEYKQTHSIKQSFSKEVREKMSDEEKKSQPFLGSLNANWGGNNDMPNVADDGKTNNGKGDVPF